MPRGATFKDVSMLPSVRMPLLSGDPAQIPWPEGDRLAETPLPPEVDKERLDAAVQAAFSDEKYHPHKTLGVVVV